MVASMGMATFRLEPGTGMLNSCFRKEPLKLELVIVGDDLMNVRLGGIKARAFLYLHHHRGDGIDGALLLFLPASWGSRKRRLRITAGMRIKNTFFIRLRV